MAWRLEDDPDVCNLYGVLYYLPWRDLPIGGSFFLPTTMDAPSARKVIVAKARKAGVIAEVYQRCEFGVLGVRVWNVGYLD